MLVSCELRGSYRSNQGKVRLQLLCIPSSLSFFRHTIETISSIIMRRIYRSFTQFEKLSKNLVNEEGTIDNSRCYFKTAIFAFYHICSNFLTFQLLVICSEGSINILNMDEKESILIIRRMFLIFVITIVPTPIERNLSLKLSPSSSW